MIDESKRFEDIMDVIGEGLCLLDKDLRVIWANKTISDWLDLKESPLGNYCKDIFRCSESGIEDCQVLKVFKGREGHIIETWITTKIKAPEESVKIDITDTGKGMTQEVLKKIFDPLFTTKSSGNGIGLAISLKIINDHGGDINVKSEFGKGTTISISLPINN